MLYNLVVMITEGAISFTDQSLDYVNERKYVLELIIPEFNSTGTLTPDESKVILLGVYRQMLVCSKEVTHLIEGVLLDHYGLDRNGERELASSSSTTEDILSCIRLEQLHIDPEISVKEYQQIFWQDQFRDYLRDGLEDLPELSFSQFLKLCFGAVIEGRIKNIDKLPQYTSKKDKEEVAELILVQVPNFIDTNYTEDFLTYVRGFRTATLLDDLNLAYLPEDIEKQERFKLRSKEGLEIYRLLTPPMIPNYINLLPIKNLHTLS